MARIAGVVDVGSNTMRLQVASVAAQSVETIHTRRVRLGLAHELETTGRISGERIAAAAEAARQLVDEGHAQHAESVDIFVTAPGRQAENAADFVAAIERAARRRVRILAPDDEARLAFAGAVALSPCTDRLAA